MPYTDLMRVRRTPDTWLQRMLGAVRSYTLSPLTLKSREFAKYSGGESTLSGISVSEESAMALSAVWSAVTMISDDIASLPLHLYKRTEKGKDRYDAHPLYRLVHDEPNPEMTSMVFRRTMQAHVCIWQNAYAEIERNAAGQPIALWPLVPERVTPVRSGAMFRYRISNPSGGEVFIDAGDMLHLVGQSHDGSVGGSIVGNARESLALTIAAEKFGASFFGNGATLSGVIENIGGKPDQRTIANKQDVQESRHAGVQRAHKWLQLWNGAKFHPISVAPDNAQFLETRNFQIREVARWFKIPPHKLADLADATFSNVEQMGGEYLSSCIRPWLVLWQQELNRKLISRLEKRQQFIEHDTHGFLMVDAAGRAALYPAEFNVGSLTPDEIRGYENRNPVEGGDQAFVQMNMIPLRLAGEYAQAQIDKLKADADATRQPKIAPVPAPPTDEQVNAFIGALEGRMAERDATLTAEADKRAEAEAKRAAAEAVAEECRGQVAVLEVDRVLADRTIAEKESEIRVLTARIEEETREAFERGAAPVPALTEERARLEGELGAARAEKSDLDMMLGAAQSAVDVAERKAKDLGDQVKALAEERDALAVRVTAAEASMEELRQRVIEVYEQRDFIKTRQEALELATREEAAARALAESRAADMDTVKAERGRATDRLAAVTQAHRALIVDAVGRLLTRESERARKAQVTPAKLRDWADTFYQTHGEVCRSVYRPVVMAWAACAGVDAERALAELVQSHIDDSRRDLRMATDDDDPEVVSANLARVLRRWEDERAEAVADRMMAEGERHGH